EIRSLILSLAKDRNITIFVSSHILSEIEQLATHMGIIHEGRLLEEIAFDKLRERNRNYLEFQVSDDNKAIMLLESQDRKSTRLNSSHVSISYAVFCLKK